VALARAYIKRLEAQAIRTGEDPMISRNFMEYSLKPGYFTGAKAERELGAVYRPFQETVADAIEYFKGRGLIA